MTNGVYPNSNGGATIPGAGSPIPAGPPHVVRYALNCGPGLNIPAWAVYIALAHFSDDHGLSERTHREIADAIDAGSVSTVKVAIQHLEYFGKVEVTRRPGATAGKNLPNVYRITGEEFDWEPTPKEPREPGQIFAAYRRRHAEIEAEHLRSYEELEQSHRQREQDLLRRIGELEAAVNGHAPRQGEDAALPMSETPGSREEVIPPEPAPQPSPDTPSPPESFRNEPPEPSEDSPAGGTAGPPQSHVLTREFWPWMKGKWDDINYAIHWYKRNRGEWTRQLKNARAARAAEERQQAKPADQADKHRPGDTVLSSANCPTVVGWGARTGMGLIAVNRADSSAAAEHYASLASSRETIMVWFSLVFDRVLGLLAHTVGNDDLATEHFEDALAICRNAGCRPDLAWTCCDYADTLLERNGEGDRTKATSLLDESLAISTELGMRPLMERVLSRREILKA